jgi:hypothetical protein
MHGAEPMFRAMHFVQAFQRLSGRFDAHCCFKRSPARITLPQMPHAASVETFRPFGNVNALAALRALDHGARARESCDIARHFHWGTSRLPETPFPSVFELYWKGGVSKAVALT